MSRQATRRSPKPRLGQHFLVDRSVLARILAAVPGDGLPIIEIGAGRGALTEPLAHLGRPLIAVELDERLAARLQLHLPARPDCRVIQGDILDLAASDLLAAIGAAPPYAVAGNLPYAITAPLFRKFLSLEPIRPRWLLLMVQREVAAQAVAPPGRRSLLSVSVQFYSEAEILFPVEPAAFDPPPRVRSAVIFLRSRPRPAVSVPSEARFFEVVRAGFRAPRKQLHNSLGLGLWQPPGGAITWLEGCGIDPMRRPATLTLEEWGRLAWAREQAGAPPALALREALV